MAGQLDDVVIVEAVRTPIGRRNGSLKDVRPDELMALTLSELMRRAGVDPSMVDDVILGCVAQIGEQGANVARLAVLEAGFPVEVPAVSLDRMCSSGQQAVHFAAQAIGSGQADVVIAGGVESMTRVPMGADYPATWSPRLTERPDLEISANQGISADLIAEKLGAQPRGAGPVRLREPPEGRRGVRVRPLRLPDHADRGADRGRAHAIVREGRGDPDPALAGADGRVAAGLRRERDGHGRQRQPDLGRRRRAAADLSTEGRRAWPATPGAPARHHGRRLGPAADADRPDPGHPQGARSGPAWRSRTWTWSRSTRRSPRWCWPGRVSSSRTWSGSTRTAAPSRWATRSARPARSC